ncbi:MAG: sigma factor [Nanoarchaeota archaeon]
MDYEDVSQIIRLHIFKKWNQYDPSKALEPWLNRVISNQISNLIRNNYGNYCRPCLRCPALESEDGCKIYGKQSSECSLYDHWLKTKKQAYDTKLPLTIENHTEEVCNMPDDFDLETSIKNVHEKMEEILKPFEFRIYRYLYIDNKTEEEVSKIMKYKTTEKTRDAGYKQIYNIKRSIINKAKKLIFSGEIDIPGAL